jgi:hypothetical protein
MDMAFPGRKVYGDSKIAECPFCGKQAITRNPQDIPVCKDHDQEELPNMKCVCGEWLDVRIGKFGPYFVCIKCGNINFRKGLEMNGMSIGHIHQPREDGKQKQVKVAPPEKTGGSDVDDINKQFLERMSKMYDDD